MRWICVALSPPWRNVFGSIVISSPSHSAKAALHTGSVTPSTGLSRFSTTSNRKVVNGGSTVSNAGLGIRLSLHDLQQALAGAEQHDGNKLDGQRGRDLEGDDQ